MVLAAHQETSKMTTSISYVQKHGEWKQQPCRCDPGFSQIYGQEMQYDN
jgi:hypothetical protein